MICDRFLTPSLLALALASCAPDKADRYDTEHPYGAPDAGPAAAQAPTAPTNPIYDTPAAYEESSAAVTPSQPGVPAPVAPAVPAAGTVAGAPSVPSAVPTAPPVGNGSAVIHTVVAGDTLSGLSSKYKVPIASIKAANRMTNDTVVLGRKMVIPPR